MRLSYGAEQFLYVANDKGKEMDGDSLAFIATKVAQFWERNDIPKLCKAGIPSYRYDTQQIVNPSVIKLCYSILDSCSKRLESIHVASGEVLGAGCVPAKNLRGTFRR